MKLLLFKCFSYWFLVDINHTWDSSTYEALPWWFDEWWSDARNYVPEPKDVSAFLVQHGLLDSTYGHPTWDCIWCTWLVGRYIHNTDHCKNFVLEFRLRILAYWSSPPQKVNVVCSLCANKVETTLVNLGVVLSLGGDTDWVVYLESAEGTVTLMVVI